MKFKGNFFFVVVLNIVKSENVLKVNFKGENCSRIKFDSRSVGNQSHTLNHILFKGKKSVFSLNHLFYIWLIIEFSISNKIQ